MLPRNGASPRRQSAGQKGGEIAGSTWAQRREMLKNHSTHPPPPGTSEHPEENDHKWAIAHPYSDTTSDSTFNTEPSD